MSGLQIGRIVHLVDNGQHLPAIILRMEDAEKGRCVLRVFHEYPIDDRREVADYHENCSNGSWHWPERM